VGQGWLLPRSLRDRVRRGHLSYFVRETARTDLDPMAILSGYDEERGNPRPDADCPDGLPGASAS
jgi:hypothetical protein